MYLTPHVHFVTHPKNYVNKYFLRIMHHYNFCNELLNCHLIINYIPHYHNHGYNLF
ncbi:323L [Invertebrate iridescent virus Kaz2018]|uniref:323L n=1 Tax=Invertebrate iridescent virus 6 TaxID=176652 RepID=Q91FK1_IIV6|nr:323L [Invertebrate iridescent virus 6]AAK82184.1 323L [Invertebrate iridescent virus 6]QMS79402.1 hypothetical protein IIV6-T1_316 [Invertebrate iridescent virus 6]QNH08733.1 323L [Invertebrate iridescent virus Kaz2018]